ncbi:MAG: bifunctional adenosylcobinamide kinase/adenosylcobinamide-phosphate guanylyltransferase [Selenomonadaceae bacterium]|nr:bifunctional adenosylcobinamide kinase/adenosylcobinamide-phosphate guanylyltransferase [Selenomonadaceae bacterium]
MGKIIFVTGGTRSGKSKFAEKLALKIGGGKAAYIATAQIFDDEMAHRVKLHKERRKENWITFESPFNADKSILFAAETFDAILFDCVTIYLSNFLCAANLEDTEKIYRDAEFLINRLIDAAENSNATIIFVSNEVGAGIVPENKLARIFRDIAGLANQTIAENSEKVFLTVAGIAVDIKNLSKGGEIF